MKINDIIAAIKTEISHSENEMEGTDSGDFIFSEEKISTLFTLSRELKMILFSTHGRTLEEFIPVLKGRIDAIETVIGLIKKEPNI